MKETEEKVDKNYLEGFNNGYFLAKYEPELAEKLSKIQAESLHVKGLQQGREQYLKEQLKERLPTLLKEQPMSEKSKSPFKGQDKSMDRE